MGMDFKQQLFKQLRFIDTSCRLYDKGDRDEAFRIAVALRVICHQGIGVTNAEPRTYRLQNLVPRTIAVFSRRSIA